MKNNSEKYQKGSFYHLSDFFCNSKPKICRFRSKGPYSHSTLWAEKVYGNSRWISKLKLDHWLVKNQLDIFRNFFISSIDVLVNDLWWLENCKMHFKCEIDFCKWSGVFMKFECKCTAELGVTYFNEKKVPRSDGARVCFW